MIENLHNTFGVSMDISIKVIIRENIYSFVLVFFVL